MATNLEEIQVEHVELHALYLNEGETSGPAASIGFPNLVSCVSLTCVLSNQSLVGAHLTSAADIETLTGRMIPLIGKREIKRIYLMGGYSTGNGIHGQTNEHPAEVARLLKYAGRVCQYDTTALGYDLGTLIVVDQPALSGACRVRYKRWSKVKPVTELVEGKHPYKPSGVPVITVDVERKPKKLSKNPPLTFHTLDPAKFTVYEVQDRGLGPKDGSEQVVHRHVYQHNQTDLEF